MRESLEEITQADDEAGLQIQAALFKFDNINGGTERNW